MNLLVLPKLYDLLVTHVIKWNEIQYFSHSSPCFGFFVCPYYSRRKKFPKLEKHGTQNKNQGEQYEFRDRWISTKTLFFKKNYMGWSKNDKRIYWDISFTKIFYKLQNQISLKEKETDTVS